MMEDAMARRRGGPEFLDGALRVFLVMPWWVGPVVIGVVFGCFWFLPGMVDRTPAHMATTFCHMFAWIVSGMLAVAWVGRLVRRYLRKREEKMGRQADKGTR
jgi:hypothetical protein